MIRSLLAAALLVGTLACRSAPRAEQTATASASANGGAPVGTPLAVLAEQRVAVTPVALLRRDGQERRGAAADSILRAVDAALATAVRGRGLGDGWIFADALARAHRRNAAFGADPYQLAVAQLRDVPAARPPARLAEPLASQLRTLVALHDDVRLVLVPVELRIDGAEAGARGTLRVALVDARSTAVGWLGDVQSGVHARVGPELANDVAARLTDLIAGR